MKLLKITILAAAFAASAQVMATTQCQVQNGYVRATGYGETKAKALAQARTVCSEKMFDLYSSRNPASGVDATTESIDACINLECE